jgi:hypothetical protein
VPCSDATLTPVFICIELECHNFRCHRDDIFPCFPSGAAQFSLVHSKRLFRKLQYVLKIKATKHHGGRSLGRLTLGFSKFNVAERWRDAILKCTGHLSLSEPSSPALSRPRNQDRQVVRSFYDPLYTRIRAVRMALP